MVEFNIESTQRIVVLINLILNSDLFEKIMSLEVGLSSVYIHFTTRFHKASSFFYQMGRNTSCYSNISSMEIHVSFLNTFNSKSTKSTKILTKTNSSNNLWKLLGIGIVKKLQTVLI